MGAKKHMLKGYHRMRERVKQYFSKFEGEGLPKLQHAIEHAKKTALELGEHTHEELEQIAESLKKDLMMAADFIVDTREEFVEWAHFERLVIEDKLMDALEKVADKTEVELFEISQGILPSEHKKPGDKE